jgi:hypothetical protein
MTKRDRSEWQASDASWVRRVGILLVVLAPVTALLDTYSHGVGLGVTASVIQVLIGAFLIWAVPRLVG